MQSPTSSIGVWIHKCETWYRSKEEKFSGAVIRKPFKGKATTALDRVLYIVYGADWKEKFNTAPGRKALDHLQKELVNIRQQYKKEIEADEQERAINFVRSFEERSDRET